MSLQRQRVSKEFFFFFLERWAWRETKILFYIFGCQNLNPFYKRVLGRNVQRLVSGKCSILIQVLSEKKIKQRVLIVLM